MAIDHPLADMVLTQEVETEALLQQRSPAQWAAAFAAAQAARQAAEKRRQTAQKRLAGVQALVQALQQRLPAHGAFLRRLDRQLAATRLELHRPTPALPATLAAWQARELAAASARVARATKATEHAQDHAAMAQAWYAALEARL